MEIMLRLGFALSVFFIMISWEVVTPRRVLTLPRRNRWLINLSLAGMNLLIMRLSVGGIAYLTAIMATEQHFGVFNQFTIPNWLAITLTLLFLDFAIYAQHVLAHKWLLLWRLHQVHHTDMDFDVTTGIRFHPIEILISMVIKFGVIAAPGVPALAVLLFEILLNATSMFNHGNVRIPGRLDRWLRWIVVTPDMHRVHHSVERGETNSNFGFNLPWWDRMFGTYRDQPLAGHNGIIIGIEQFRDPAELRLDRMLLQPFRDPSGPHPFGGDDKSVEVRRGHPKPWGPRS